MAELKAQLSRYLSRVKAGEEVLVTERGIPIARLVPAASSGTMDEQLRDLERQGLIRLGPGVLPKDIWKLPRSQDPGAALRRAVTEEREDGR